MADSDIDTDYVQTTLNGLLSEAESAISDLKTVAMAYYQPQLTEAGFDNNPSWDIERGREVALSGLSSLPADIPTFDKPAFVFNPEDYINSDLLTRYSYDSEFFDEFLDPRLREYIDSQAYFLAQEVQDALFEVSRQRDLQTLNDAIDAVTREQARRGFPVPNSVMMAARNDVIKKYQDTYADRNKEITALIADKSLQEKMHAMDTGIKMEDIRSRFQLEYGKLYWQAADYLIRKFESDIRAEIAEYQGQLDMIKTKADIDKIGSDKDLAYTTLEHQREVERLHASIAEMNAYLDAWKTHITSEMNAAKDAVEYYKNVALGVSGMLNRVDYKDFTG